MTTLSENAKPSGFDDANKFRITVSEESRFSICSIAICLFWKVAVVYHKRSVVCTWMFLKCPCSSWGQAPISPQSLCLRFCPGVALFDGGGDTSFRGRGGIRPLCPCAAARPPARFAHGDVPHNEPGAKGRVDVVRRQSDWMKAMKSSIFPLTLAVSRLCI